MYLAWKEIRRYKGRFFFMIMIIVLLSYLVLFISGLASGLGENTASSIKQFKNQTFIIQKEADGRINRSTLSSDTVETLRKRLGETHASALTVQSTTTNRIGKDQKIDTTLIQIGTGTSLRPELTNGKRPSTDSSVEVIADQSIQKSGIHLNDRIKEQGSGIQYKITGFTTGWTFLHMPVIFLNYKQWNLLKQKEEQKMGPLSYSAVTTPISSQKTQHLIKGLKLNQKVSVSPVTEIVQKLPGYSEEQGSLMMMISFLFIVSVFILGIFFYIITMQKKNQLGILKAVGTGNKYLAVSLLIQSLIVLTISLTFSLLLTWLTAMALPVSMPFHLTAGLIAGRIIVFVIVSIVSILISIWQIIRIDALSAIEGR